MDEQKQPTGSKARDLRDLIAASFVAGRLSSEQDWPSALVVGGFIGSA